ncbi:MAG: RNA-protein complex protein Nop10 [Methanobrevibacter sp.]|jgi:H/ACA ribonucleoprotein complex subunit 3|nr:RNA-protein complex protein Nop10 [Candidatus Methanoflexus mossambicus]
MKMKMKRCNACMIYTLKDLCPKCGGDLNVIYPPKYSIEDKYGKYRRKFKEELIDSQT